MLLRRLARDVSIASPGARDRVVVHAVEEVTIRGSQNSRLPVSGFGPACRAESLVRSVAFPTLSVHGRRFSDLRAERRGQMIYGFLDLIYGKLDEDFWFVESAYIRCAAYWLITYLLLRAACWFGRHVLYTIYKRTPFCSNRIWDREAKAARLARTYFPRSATPRTDLAVASAPPPDHDQRIRAFRTARRLQSPISSTRLRRWALLDCWKARTVDALVDALRVLSGITGVVLSLVAVLWVRPSNELSTDARERISDLTGISDSLLSNTAITRFWPIALFVLTLLVVGARQSAVLDRICARDEAAKDANRLLAELCGALIRVRYQLMLWDMWLTWQFEYPLVDARVVRFTNGAYCHSMRGAGGIQRRDPRTSKAEGLDAELDGFQSSLSAVLDDLAGVCQKITTAGLTTVCWRLTTRISRPIVELELLNQHEVVDPSIRFSSRPATVKTLLDRPVFAWPCTDFDTNERNYDAVSTASVNSAEREMFEFRARLSDLVCDLAVTDYNCRRVINHLNRRMHGSPLQRIASAMAK
ncbi:hypothetical protein ACQPW1_11280 [Nocardia sp. CA-128927]|uniref:hypothetical protein n=1 Tax=Nocardia sp. CA-128927 TaxID=3239975 RepID=UPI003D960143